jgi:hypothetical protein
MNGAEASSAAEQLQAYLTKVVPVLLDLSDDIVSTVVTATRDQIQQ